MKRLTVLVLAVVLNVGMGIDTAAAQSQGVIFDGALIFATEPASAFDPTIGVGFGLSVDMTDRMDLGDKNAKFHLRGDISYFKWKESGPGFKAEYTRIPIFGGVRYFLPVQHDSIDVFVEGGLELSLDEAEVTLSPLPKVSESELHLGITPGVGIEFPAGDTLVVGGNLRWHIITDDYFTLGAYLGVKF